MSLKISLKIWTFTILLIFISISLLFLYCTNETKIKLSPLSNIETIIHPYNESQENIISLQKMFFEVSLDSKTSIIEEALFQVKYLQKIWEEKYNNEKDPTLRPQIRFLIKKIEDIHKSIISFNEKEELNQTELISLLSQINTTELFLNTLKSNLINQEIQTTQTNVKKVIANCIIALTIGCSIGMILILWLNFQVSARINSNIHVITQAISRSLDGERGLEIHASIPEFRTLISTCNTLIKTLHEHSDLCRNTIKQEEQIRKALIETIKDPIIAVGLNGDILASNTAFRLLINESGNFFLAELQKAIMSGNQENFEADGINYALIPKITPKSCSFEGRIFQILKK